MRAPSEFFKHLNIVGFQPKTIIDIGVAKGTPDLYKAYPNAYYVLVEAVKEYEQELKRILASHKGEYHISAVSNQPGKMEMMVKEPFYISSLQYDKENLKDKNAIRKVDVITVDQLFAKGKYEPPVLIKTDCQGHDLNVIMGAKDNLEKIEVIICELPLYGPWGGGYEFYDYVVEMDKLGYRVYDIWGWLYRPHDQRLQHLDLVFVKKDGLLRQNKLFTQGKLNIDFFAKNNSVRSVY